MPFNKPQKTLELAAFSQRSVFWASYQLDVPRKPPKEGILMPGPPKPAPFDEQEQRLDSEFPPDVGAPHPVGAQTPYRGNSLEVFLGKSNW